MNQTLILKGIVGALQIALIVLLITSGVHFKDVKGAKDLINETTKAGVEWPAEVLNKINAKYGALLTLIILSTLKVPVIAAGLFLNHILILFGSFIVDMVVGLLYFIQWVVITDAYPAGSWLGMVTSVTCGVMTVMLVRLIKREVR